MNLKQYQHLHKLRKGADELNNTADCIAYYFNLTKEQINAFSQKDFKRYCQRFDKKFSAKPSIFTRNRFTTDARKINMAQFFEIVEWLKKGEVESLHLIAATILKKRKDHKLQSEKLLQTKASKIVYFVAKFLISYEVLISEFKYLFDNTRGSNEGDGHPFIATFGWMYSIKNIADYCNITIDEAYNMNVIEGLNVLSYCKGLGEYYEYLQKKK